ncbi:hypothetical protein [Streptomyces sp. NPDC092952]|uniref:hypothetical protein n=1 Tax=Streptomyces sp. NPDC092952 TaxID=3366018 RepID=UPI00381621F3
MSDGNRPDRARAFVPALIPEPLDLENATGPLTPKELKYLGNVHAARDHFGNARWMRGKALAAAFSRRLFRGEDGTRTRQQYLDDEWDGMSETAAYREIAEWPLASLISELYERPAPDSHVRALVDVAQKHGAEPVATAYTALRRHGTTTGQRVTAKVVNNLAAFLDTGRALPAAEDQAAPKELEGLFTSRQLPGPRPEKKTAKSAPAEPSVVIPKFGNDDGWRMNEDQAQRLRRWITAEAQRTGTSPDEVFETVLGLLTSDPAPQS